MLSNEEQKTIPDRENFLPLPPNRRRVRFGMQFWGFRTSKAA